MYPRGGSSFLEFEWKFVRGAWPATGLTSWFEFMC